MFAVCSRAKFCENIITTEWVSACHWHLWQLMGILPVRTVIIYVTARCCPKQSENGQFGQVGPLWIMFNSLSGRESWFLWLKMLSKIDKASISLASQCEEPPLKKELSLWLLWTPSIHRHPEMPSEKKHLFWTRVVTSIWPFSKLEICPSLTASLVSILERAFPLVLGTG